MKQNNLVMLAWLLSFVLLSGLVCKADTKVPCLIFSGNAEKEHCIDLANLNRITFGDNSMVISSSSDGNNKTVELLYSLYHHLEIGDGFPDKGAGIEAVDADSDSRIYVDSQAKLLYLTSTFENRFSVGVFNTSGLLLMTSELISGDALSIEALGPGIYIAVATNGDTKLTLKFILN